MSLVVEDLHVWFDLGHGRTLHAVQGVDLDLAPGDRVGLVGESGCGKTTTVLAVMGLLPTTASVAGGVFVDGENVLGYGESAAGRFRWRKVALVSQAAMNALNPVRRIRSQIVEPMRVHGTHSARAARARADELLTLVGLPVSVGERCPHEISGGMRQRAVIAMALACEPQVLLADEPTTALDVMVQAQVMELLLRLTSDLGLALLLVTHDLALVSRTCARAAVMYGGKVVEQGPVEDLYNRPGHPYTRRLFAATPDLGDWSPLESIPGNPPRLDGPVVGCSFAPRCDRFVDRCGARTPPLIEIGAGHLAACLLHDGAPARAGGGA